MREDEDEETLLMLQFWALFDTIIIHEINWSRNWWYINKISSYQSIWSAFEELPLQLFFPTDFHWLKYK